MKGWGGGGAEAVPDVPAPPPQQLRHPAGDRQECQPAAQDRQVGVVSVNVPLLDVLFSEIGGVKLQYCLKLLTIGYETVSESMSNNKEEVDK